MKKSGCEEVRSTKNEDLKISSAEFGKESSSENLDDVKDSSKTTDFGKENSSENLDDVKDSSKTVVDENLDAAVKLAEESYKILQGINKETSPNPKLKKTLLDLFKNKPASSREIPREEKGATDYIDKYLEKHPSAYGDKRQMEIGASVGILYAQKKLDAITKNDEKEELDAQEELDDEKKEKKTKKQKTTK